MGNNEHVLRSGQVISIFLLVSALAFMLPATADAASLTDQVKKRLCDRQDRLAGRLARALINPSLCEKPSPAPEPTLAFGADPSEIEAGESSTLSWSTMDATSCTASGGWSGSRNTSGSRSVSPSEDTTYTLTCSGPGGSVSESVTVSVDEEEPLPEPTLEFDADPTEVDEGGVTTLAWDSTDAAACIASDGWSGLKPVDGSEAVTVHAMTTYTLECGNGVSTTTRSVTVDVTEEPEPEPAVEITADPMIIDEGATTTLAWDSENVTVCVASNGWSDEKPLDGTQEVSPSVTTTYAIECTGPGGTAQDSVTVTVDETQEAPEVDLSADPEEVTPGEGSATSTLTWTTSDADFCLASGGWSDAKDAEGGSEIVEPTETSVYTLECGNEAGTTTDSVTVGFVPEEEPAPDHLVISEVYYDVDEAHGVNSTNDNNEWIEIYNPTDSTVDLSGWDVSDNSSSDPIPDGVSLAPGAYLVITATSSTEGFWDIPDGTQVLILGNQIGNGLSAGGDVVFLRDGNDAVVDAVSWVNTDAFDPAAPDVAQGHSLYRPDLTVDTDTAADWADDDTPEPGV